MNKTEKFWGAASKNYDKTEERLEYIHSKSKENTSKLLKDSDTILGYGCKRQLTRQFIKCLAALEGLKKVNHI